MKNQRRRLLALVAVVLACTMVLPFLGSCSKKEKDDPTKTAAQAVKKEKETAGNKAPATSKTPVVTKSDPNAESLQSTPNKGGSNRVTSGTTSVKSQYSKEQEALSKLDVNKAQNVEDRRNYAEAYMRAMLTFEWSLEERPATQAGTTGGKTFYLHDYADQAAWEAAVNGASGVFADADNYTYKVGKYTFPLKAGRTYRGLPYSNGDSGLETFKLFVESTNDKGVAVMNDRFDVVYLYGGEAIARLGNTEATALIYAWNTVSYSSRATSINHMVPNNGYYFVEGVKVPLLSPEDQAAATPKPPIPDPNGVIIGGEAGELTLTYDNSLAGDTDEIVKHNGEQGMYAAYANAKKADGMIRSDGTVDAKMVVSVNVVKNPDGTIDGDASNVIVLAQTHRNLQDEVVDANGVYLIGEVDRKMTFRELYEGNFVPMTVKELIDGTPTTAAMVRDAYKYTSRQTGSYIYSGVINGSRRILWVNTVITDEAGNVLFNNTAFAERADVKTPAATETGRYTFDLGKLDDSHEKIVSIGNDVISNSTLGKGTFHYKVTARMITGEDIVVRDYTYTNK